MKPQTFSNSNKSWDRYKAFHHETGARRAFVLFETGELMYNEYRMNPAARCVYADQNIALTYSTDGTYKFATMEGDKIPTAQLSREGATPLLVDLDHKVAVFCGWNNTKVNTLPNHLRTAKAWYWNTAKDSLPNGGSDIVIASPFVATNEYKEWRKEVYAIATSLNELEDPYKFSYYDSRRPLEAPPDQRDPHKYVTSLDRYNLARLALYGFAPRYDKRTVPMIRVL